MELLHGVLLVIGLAIQTVSKVGYFKRGLQFANYCKMRNDDTTSLSKIGRVEEKLKLDIAGNVCADFGGLVMIITSFII